MCNLEEVENSINYIRKINDSKIILLHCVSCYPTKYEDLNLKFHYFFMRKFWFLYSAKAFVVWPGGFGTLDELMELLTLIQTRKIKKRLPIVLYGRDYWKNVINWNYLVDIGTISKEDLKLFHISDEINDSYTFITSFLEKQELEGPNF